MDDEKKKLLKYKNYTLLFLLLLFMAIMFGLTIIKMKNSKIQISCLTQQKYREIL